MFQVSGVEYDRAGVAAHAKNLATKVKGGLEVSLKPRQTRGRTVSAWAHPTVRAAHTSLPEGQRQDCVHPTAFSLLH